MRIIFCLLYCASLLSAAESGWLIDFEKGGLKGWHVPLPGHWELAVEDGNHFLRLAQAGPIGDPRRPVKFALWKPGCVSDFEVKVKVRRKGKSLLVAFGFQDRLHFYYAHVSLDDGDYRVHNGIFKVDGGERYRIGGTGAKPALPTTDWHTVRVVRKTGPGTIEVYIDGQPLDPTTGIDQNHPALRSSLSRYAEESGGAEEASIPLAPATGLEGINSIIEPRATNVNCCPACKSSSSRIALGMES